MRKAAVIALGIFGPGDKDVLPALSKALAADKDEMVRLQIVAVLGSLKSEVLRDSLPTLADTLKDDKSSAVKAATATLIGKLGSSRQTSSRHTGRSTEKYGRFRPRGGN